MNKPALDTVVEHHQQMTPQAKSLISWLAAALGIGSAADLVPLILGVLSVAWIMIQAYGYLTIDRPNKLLDRENKKLDQEIKRAKLQALLRGIADADEAACEVRDVA